MENNKKLSLMLEGVLEEGLNFDYREITQFDNSKPSLEEAFKHNEYVRGSVIEKEEGSTRNVLYPATLTVFKKK